MNELELHVGDGDIEEIVAAVMDGLEAAPLPESVPPYRPKPVAIALRNQAGGIEGGLTGHSVWDWLYVKYLWVAENRRGSGYGERLLDAAEREAKNLGCLGIWLSTLSFQAPGFYERFGYRRFGHLDDFPAGHQRIFYQKRLT